MTKSELSVWIGKVSRLIEKGIHVEHHREILAGLMSRYAEDEAIVIEATVISEEVSTVEQAIIAKEKSIAAIDKKVFDVKGTWVKHSNVRNKLTERHNELLEKQIDTINKKLALMRSESEQSKRSLYHAKTLLNLQIIH